MSFSSDTVHHPGSSPCSKIKSVDPSPKVTPGCPRYPLSWRRYMGIEPTSPDSRLGPTGFEDQAHHQIGRTSIAQLGRFSISPTSLWRQLMVPTQSHSFPADQVGSFKRRSQILINAVQVVHGPTDRLFFQQGKYRSFLQFGTILHIGPVRVLCTPSIRPLNTTNLAQGTSPLNIKRAPQTVHPIDFKTLINSLHRPYFYF